MVPVYFYVCVNHSAANRPSLPDHREDQMKTTILALAAAAAMISTPALADPILGNWRTASGETAQIASCGSAFCITLSSGAYAGKQIGRVAKDGSKYSGTITDPTNDRKYKGEARLSGSTLKMKGCFGVCTPVTSRTENWQRQ